MLLRPASKQDIAAIAALHALSWQQNYHEVLSKQYLKDKVLDDRLSIWTARLTEPAEDQYVLVAENEGTLCGFICLYANKHNEYGTLIDNLHVHSDVKGKGIGTLLLNAGMSWAAQRHKEAGMYLEVLAPNVKAIAFYQARGAKKLTSGYWHTPCGNKVKEYIYHWVSVPELIN